MRSSRQKLLGITGALVLGVVMLSPAVVMAQGVILDDEDSASSDSELVAKPKSMLGVGVRLRQIVIPESLIELFVEDAPGGGSHTGYGIEFIRMKGNLAISLGVEYEGISTENGIYIERGHSIPQDGVDYVEFEDFKWVGVDASFVWHQPLISDKFFLRYGAGLGLGVIMGKMIQTDYNCANGNTDSCVETPGGIVEDDNVPPVLPIINVILGVQLRPFDNLAITFEGGIRTAPFFGTTLSLMI